MKFEDLSEDAKSVLKGMVELCLDKGYCMGMDEGFDKNDNKYQFRKELEAFVYDKNG